MKSKFEWSNFQTDIFDCIKNTNASICISANAGSSKTTTIVEGSKYLPKFNYDTLFLAFNVHIVKELRNCIPMNIQVSTLHSFCARILYKHFPNIKFDENKVFKTALRMFAGFETNENKYVYCNRLQHMVELMQLTLSTETNQIEDICDKYAIPVFGNEVEDALAVFKQCNKIQERISFTDMIYRVATLDIKVPKFHCVFLDEAQDISKAGQAVIRKIIRKDIGRLISVGDRNQAIYGFAGGDYQSFDRIKSIMPNTVEFPLPISYRCPKLVIEYAQRTVPSIQVWKKAKEGIIAEESTIDEIIDGDWVLCRNTMPLVYVFRELVKQHKKANIKGREIGQNLINIINKTKRKRTDNVIKFMQVYLIQLKSKLYKRGYGKPEQHPRYVDLNEKIEIVKILSENVANTVMLVKKINSIFIDTDNKGIMLSTIHKSKGLEAKRIFILNRDLMPSKYAVTEDDFIQENNLFYVGVTRSKSELRFLNIPEEVILTALNTKNKPVKLSPVNVE